MTCTFVPCPGRVHPLGSHAAGAGPQDARAGKAQYDDAERGAPRKGKADPSCVASAGPKSAANELQATVQSRTARVERALAWLGGALHLGLVVMLRGQAVVYLPSAWVTPLGWLLALPGAPAGSVSVMWWIAICRSVVRRLLAPLRAPMPHLGTSNPLGAMLSM